MKIEQKEQYMELIVVPMQEAAEDLETTIANLSKTKENNKNTWADGVIYGLRYALLTMQEKQIKIFKKEEANA